MRSNNIFYRLLPARNFGCRTVVSGGSHDRGEHNVIYAPRSRRPHADGVIA